ncbi:hypothetical protein NL676_024806 [Syzygium grande]|nr:hypothetical protein NL676_024806 [Syzygium grande]
MPPPPPFSYHISQRRGTGASLHAPPHAGVPFLRPCFDRLAAAVRRTEGRTTTRRIFPGALAAAIQRVALRLAPAIVAYVDDAPILTLSNLRTPL